MQLTLMTLRYSVHYCTCIRVLVKKLCLIDVTLNFTAPPTVTADSATVVTIEGNTVVLVCNATGDPVPVQSWSQNGSVLTSGGQYNISSDGRVLAVQGVTEAQDEGEFTCHASNVAGNDSATLMLSVQGSLTICSADLFLYIIVQAITLKVLNH